MKKIILWLLVLIPCFIKADGVTYEASIGDNYYSTLEEAYEAAKNDDVIVLRSNVFLEKTLVVSKKIVINMNGKNIQAKQEVLSVKNGNLKLTGKGTILETTPTLYGILLRGSKTVNDTDYSTVEVGKDVTVKAWAPIFIDRYDADNKVSYGVKALIYGNLIGTDNQSDSSGPGVYINGDVKNKTNYPQVTLYDGASITATGPGIYQAGYAKTIVNKATITGIESGIAIKSGILNLLGATINATGAKKDPVAASGSVNPTGAVLQIESNKAYAGDMEITIDGGTYTSKNSYVIVEYLAEGTDQTQVKSFEIKSGKFTSGSGVPIFLLSSSFKEKFGKFIKGGEFSEDVDDYKTVSKEYDIDIEEEKDSPLGIIIVIVVLLVAGYFGYKYYLKNYKKY